MSNKLLQLCDSIVRDLLRGEHGLYAAAQSGIDPAYRRAAAHSAGSATAVEGVDSGARAAVEQSRIAGVGLTEAELIQLARGTDSRLADRNLIDRLDYHRLYLEAQRWDFSDESAWDEVLHLGLVEHGHPALAQTLRERGYANLSQQEKKEVLRLGLVNHGDPALAHILRRQGFDGLPRLVDAAGMRELIAGGWKEMTRAVRRPEDATAFATGDNFAGRGTLGNGTYVYGRAPGATEPDSARLHEMTRRHGDNVIRMALHETALTTDLRSLTAEWNRELAAIRAEMAQLPESSAGRRELAERLFVLSDKGRYAAVRGYDAYWVNDSNYWVVLNRTGLLVESPGPGPLPPAV